MLQSRLVSSPVGARAGIWPPFGGPPSRCTRCKVTDDNPFSGTSSSSNGSSSIRSASGASDAQPTAKVTPPADGAVAAESRLELLEASVKGKKAAIAAAKAKVIPIKGMVSKEKEDSSPYAPWQEGQLFPDGWDDMPLSQKLTELYMGRRGILFWSTQAAWFSVLALLGGWVLFRVGALLGLYTLSGDGPPPPY